MKKKRIILHIIILVMAVVSMGTVFWGIKKYENPYGGSKESFQKTYKDTYLTNVYTVLMFVRKQIEAGKGINDIDSEMSDIDLGYKVVAGKKNNKKKTYVHKWNKENGNMINHSYLDENGLSIHKDTAYDFLLYLDLKDFYQMLDYENINGIKESYHEDLKFLKRHKITLEFAVNKEDSGTLSSLKEKIDKAPTDKECIKTTRRIITCFIIAGAIVVLAFIPFIYLLIIAGHRKKGDRPYTNRFDKMWMDVIAVTSVIVYTVLLSFAYRLLFVNEIFSGIFRVNAEKVMIPWAVYNLFAIEAVLQISESIIRRIKSKCLFKTTLTGSVILSVKRLIMKLARNTKSTKKVVAVGIFTSIFMIFNYILVYRFSGIFIPLILIGLPIIAVCAVLWVYFKEKQIIIEETAKIADGQVDNKIYDPMKFSSNKILADEINRIGEGMSKAVDLSVKNERMKTELITNVSHDIKTPLTSIINYVDLLKTDGLDSEKAQEYLEILDRKSQRLKTLTEDLVEASKLNSGVIKLKIEDIDIVQLVNQSLAEYNERFRENDLHIIKNISRDTIIVKADGRKTWRALDNLYSNVCKYAMPGTRVYIDITEDDKMAVLSIKNISQGALNFSADELMERFVRGDVSRTTEGSGLGLSIAKTIMERQNGELRILLDGDLFKVEIRLIKKK